MLYDCTLMEKKNEKKKKKIAEKAKSVVAEVHSLDKEFCLRPPLKICIRKVSDLVMKLRRFQNQRQ